MLDACKSKGTSVINTRKFLISRVGQEKFDQLAIEVGLPSKIVSSSWVNVETICQLFTLASKELNVNTIELVRASAAYTLAEDLNGIYKLFMRGAGVVSVLGRSPRMIKTYTNYGEAVMLQNEMGFVKVCYSFKDILKSYPEILEIIMASLSGAADGILQVCKYNMDSWAIVEQNFDPDVPGCTAVVECKYTKV